MKLTPVGIPELYPGDGVEQEVIAAAVDYVVKRRAFFLARENPAAQEAAHHAFVMAAAHLADTVEVYCQQEQADGD